MKSLSHSEWKIMKVIWSKEYATASDILSEVDENWKSSTVRTMLSRLVKKGVLSYRHNKKEYIYFSIIPQEEVLQKETKSFLGKLYGITLKSAMVNFIQDDQLSVRDIDELVELLEEKRGKLEGNSK